MTPLRSTMIKAMRMRGFSARTHQSYLAAVAGLARHTRRSPERLSAADVNHYFEYLVTERELAPASCRLYFNGFRNCSPARRWPASSRPVRSASIG